MKLLILIFLPFIGFGHCISGDCQNGYGTYTSQEGTYKVDWKYGDQHGEGTFIEKSGGKYVGECKNSKEHGLGTHTFSASNAKTSIYDIAINDISGKSIDLGAFRGKYILFVNVASECGFTPQYAGLEELHQQYKNDLIVIGLPCNQFGEQEPEAEEEIQQFCTKNFGVSFLMTEKIEVKGDGQHPLYTWLCSKEKNGKLNSTVKWNFQKYLTDEKGEFVDYFYSTTKPMSIKITSILKQ